ncbi:MAG: HAMP domain-containing histidine kinase [Bacilli bacterium]|nr:HAMP domain-containing histidine kinase [Bacilli bacterium]
MKNNINYKKYIFFSLIITIIFSICFYCFNLYNYKNYSYKYNLEIDHLITYIKEINPEIDEKEIFNSIRNNESTSLFEKYGVDIRNESIFKDNNKRFNSSLIISSIIFILSSLTSILVFCFYSYKKENEINKITKIIKEINKKNYELDIKTMSEDELSILKNEIYKTMINLKETSELNILDKVNLKRSLEDISHQLKTPLTSILIMLDNLIDNPDMDLSLREDFLRDIKLETNKINFLVQNILKLSKFESNTIELKRSEESISKLVNESINNVDVLADLKNIKINKKIISDSLIKIDFSWQKEAITNLIKNAIEHSERDTNIDIIVDTNNVYSSIKVINYNSMIDKEDIKNIFKRFYKSKNSSKESIGIGLSLAKTIIEADNGSITVESNEEKTIFVVKYFKI